LWLAVSGVADDADELAGLERRREELYRELGQVGDFRRGSLNEVRSKCGKPGCVCAAPDHPGHGPQWNLTRKLEGRTRAVQFRRAADREDHRPPLPVGVADLLAVWAERGRVAHHHGAGDHPAHLSSAAATQCPSPSCAPRSSFGSEKYDPPSTASNSGAESRRSRKDVLLDHSSGLVFKADVHLAAGAGQVEADGLGERLAQVFRVGAGVGAGGEKPGSSSTSAHSSWPGSWWTRTVYRPGSSAIIHHLP
jgi:hypothetical protein